MENRRTEVSRRDVLKFAGALGAAQILDLQTLRSAKGAEQTSAVVVNDAHSKLNATRVCELLKPTSIADLQNAVRTAASRNEAVSVCGGRHAMGGQQFGDDTLLLDTSRLKRVVDFDADTGQVEVEAGIHWPTLIDHLQSAQREGARQWTINQKQTGANRLSLGGMLAANGHGRGLRLRPFIQDIESFTLIDATGELRRCSRSENPELFRLAIGGYGLFGVVATIRLRLVPRQILRRMVEIRTVDGLIEAFDRRIAEGHLYGDFQFATDPGSEDFLNRGVFACYCPAGDVTSIPERQRKLSEADWRRLIHLAHTDKGNAFKLYADHYRSTNGQLYWSDTQQLSLYVDDYHRQLDKDLHAEASASEVITEIYVPRARLVQFLADVRTDFRKESVDLIYGTIRLIERDGESFLAWAREPYACVIFNLHTVHTPAGIEKAASDFRRLIDMAIACSGSYYLTYHRWATAQQVEACYPQFIDFLRQKRRHDPQERFQSEWYRHYRNMFQDRL